MSEPDDRIGHLQEGLDAVQVEIEKRHHFTLKVFSCVIDLWSISMQIYEQMPPGPEAVKFFEKISILRNSIVDAQETGNSIVAPYAQHME